jgi:hypothetical protein
MNHKQCFGSGSRLLLNPEKASHDKMFYKFAIDMIFDVFSNLQRTFRLFKQKISIFLPFSRDNYGLPGSRKPNPDPKTQSNPVLIRIRNTAPHNESRKSLLLGVTPPKPGRQREKNLWEREKRIPVAITHGPILRVGGGGSDYTLSFLGIKIL